MGSLIPPESGVVYFDANAFIYSVEKTEPYRTSLDPVWQSARKAAIKIASSEIVIVETLVRPIREGDHLLEDIYRGLLLNSTEVNLIPISHPILDRAARIRAKTGLKTPDAIHAATALECDAKIFITNDASVRRVPGLPIAVLSEYG